jgi:predicted site-specific integrase-resolvase
MLAPILGTARSSVQPQFMRVQSCARLLGVSVQTVRNYADNPANGVEVRRSPGGHRFIDLAAIAQVFGYDVASDEPDPEATPESARLIIGYCRVSTSKQKTAGNLDRQKERVEQYIRENWPGEKYIIITEQRSGISTDRPGLLKVLDLSLASKCKILCAEHPCRISRGSFALISRVLQRCGVEIVLTKTGEKENDAKTQEEETLHDAMSMIYCMQARACGRRAHDKTRFVASPAFRDRVAGLYAQGMTAARIWAAVRGEGHHCQNTGKPASVKSVWNLIKEIERGAPSKRVPESVRRFVKEGCVVSQSQTVLTRDVWAAFCRYCDQHGLPRVSRNKLPAFLRAAVPSVQTRLASHHADGFEMVGLTLKT